MTGSELVGNCNLFVEGIFNQFSCVQGFWYHRSTDMQVISHPGLFYLSTLFINSTTLGKFMNEKGVDNLTLHFARILCGYKCTRLR